MTVWASIPKELGVKTVRVSPVYVAPDFQLKIKELPKYIKIKVMTKGYDSFKGDNLMLCIGLIGKITNNSTTNYKVSIEEVIEGIGSKGSKLLKPPEIDPMMLAGQEWNLSRITEDKESNTVLYFVFFYKYLFLLVHIFEVHKFLYRNYIVLFEIVVESDKNSETSEISENNPRLLIN